LTREWLLITPVHLTGNAYQRQAADNTPGIYGMPDIWETSHSLDPSNANDRNGHNLDPDYTNLEVYLDWLVSSVRTDIVYDGIVNFCDFARFAEHWNNAVGSPLYDERYDFNRNDTISMDDLFYIAQDWLTSGQEY
jgi:hypothetical protein